MTEATWLAKRVMAQVEYNYDHYQFKDLEIDKEMQFKVDSSETEFDYTYKLRIFEWKLPLFDLLMEGGPKNPDEDDDGSSESAPGGLAGIPGIKQVIDSLFDGHIMKIANVEVFWPEGARRDSVTLTMLMTNQKALDAHIISKKEVMKKMLVAVEESVLGKKKKKKKEKTEEEKKKESSETETDNDG